MRETAKRPDGVARLALVGDLMLARKVSAAFINGRAPEAFWGNVRPALLAADAVVGNLESALTATTERWGSKAFHFCADPRTVAILSAGNVRCVNLANNHTLDGKEAGLVDTLKQLDAAGIVHAGAGKDIAEALAPAIFQAGGRTVGLVSLTNTLRAFAAGPSKTGTAYIPLRADSTDALLLGELVASLRVRGADFLILSIHWGPNLRPWPPRRYRAFARRAIELGFDIVHGHSAHILQAIEYHQRGLILYDTGDFLDDYWVFPGVRIDRSFLFQVEAARGRPPALRLLPVLIGDCAVNRAEGREAEAIRNGMIRRCRRYAVEFAVDGEALVASPPAHHDATSGPVTASTSKPA